MIAAFCHCCSVLKNIWSLLCKEYSEFETIVCENSTRKNHCKYALPETHWVSKVFLVLSTVLNIWLMLKMMRTQARL